VVVLSIFFEFLSINVNKSRIFYLWAELTFFSVYCGILRLNCFARTQTLVKYLGQFEGRSKQEW